MTRAPAFLFATLVLAIGWNAVELLAKLMVQ